MALTGEERREIFGELMTIDRRLMAKIEAVAKCARAKITWQVLLVFVGLAAGAIGFVWYNLGESIGRNRDEASAASQATADLRGDVKTLQESFSDFRAEQRSMNKDVMQRLEKIQKGLSD